LSNLVDFEDLSLLDGNDLRAVFGQVPLEQVLTSLVGVTPAFRRHLLGKLPGPAAAQIELQVSTLGPVSFAAVQAAQRELIEVLCRLSRVGQVAFDDPEDMVA
jgi:flagellar motor switch protein FliG